MTGNSTIDSLTEIYGMISVSESPYWFVLEFAQPLKIPLLSQLYKVVAGVIDAWPKYVCCVIDNIEAFMKDQIWHLAFTHGWGDCPAGCIHRYYWYVTVDKNLNTLLVEERYRDFGTPWIYLWNIPPRYAATVFNNLGELFSAAQFAPEWWVRRHAVEVIGLLFVKDYPWVGEDFSNQTIFDALKDGVLSRRKEVIRILQRRMGDPDPDVRTSAQRALNRALGLSEESLAFYFPLHVGNSWTFLDASAFSPSTFTETTVDTQHIGGNHYFQFDRFRHFPNVLLRMSEDDKLLMRWDGEKQVWLDFSADVGDTWTVSAPGDGSQWLVHLESKTDT
ncbi:MAG: HEAT repeat domain-containing protein, partial [bacterium]